MIISCENCNKKFELSDDLIPVNGRLLKYGSCLHEWHFTPDKPINLNEEAPKSTKRVLSEKTSPKPKLDKINTNKNDFKKNKKKIGFLSFLWVSAITIIAMMLVIDTFKYPISHIIPDIDFYLLSLYETLKDILLFFKDLMK